MGRKQRLLVARYKSIDKMNAKDAFEIATSYWLKNDVEPSKYILGWEQRVKDAAEKGFYNMHVAIVPLNFSGYFIQYFEQLGYHVQFSPGPDPMNWSLNIFFNVFPLTRRSIAAQRLQKLLAEIPEE